MRRPPKHRPLLSKTGLWALIIGTLVVLVVLLPFAQGRLHKAVLLAPSSLSISYLKLGLDKRPDDAALRMDLVKKLIETGQIAEARRHLLRLTPARDALGMSARLMLVEVDLNGWAAIEPGRRDARATALARVLADMRAIDVAELPEREVERFARRYRELDQPLAAAELFDALAEHGLSPDLARIGAADAAWQAAGLPARAAELHAQAALKPRQTPAQGIMHARLALDRIRGVADPEAGMRMVERLRAAYPADAGLLEVALRTAEEHDVQSAFERGVELVALAPREVRYHRHLARLAEATGRSLRALDEYVWLVRHGGDAADRARALALAKANWDLPLYRQLLGAQSPPEAPRGPAKCKRRKGQCRARTRAPQRPRSARRCQAGSSGGAAAARGPTERLRALRERVALDEALGDAAAAEKKLTAAVESEFAEVSELWQRKFDLELRMGDRAAAQVTALHMVERFPGRAASERLAGIQLALGQTHAALHTLLTAQLDPSQRDEAWLRKLALLAFEAGEHESERQIYEALIALPQASFWDYQRLWELAPDRPSALRIALAAFERFESLPMLTAAVELYRAEGNEAALIALLERAGRIDKVAANVQYWQISIGLRQQRAVRAIAHEQYPLAKQELVAAERLLQRAVERTAAQAAEYAPLWAAQYAQMLSLGLASDDVPMIARAYAERHELLSLRDRVYVLRRLQRNDEALNLARDSLARRDLSESDRGALESTVIDLSQDTRRYAGASADVLRMDGLLVQRNAAFVEYTQAPFAVRGEVSFTQYQPRATADPVLEDDADELATALQGRFKAALLEVGARMRDESRVRPFGALELQFVGKPGAGALARVQLNQLATDTARLRALGVRDALVLDAALPITAHFYATARSSFEVFYTEQQRDYLGVGSTTDVGLGATTSLPADTGVAGLRLVTRLAPRFAQHFATAWLPETTEWVGIGASLSRAQLGFPPSIGRRFGYLLDGAVGWLWPASGIGFSAQAGVGFSIFGADLLTLGAHGGNVVGSTAWGAGIGYGITIDR